MSSATKLLALFVLASHLGHASAATTTASRLRRSEQSAILQSRSSRASKIISPKWSRKTLACRSAMSGSLSAPPSSARP